MAMYLLHQEETLQWGIWKIDESMDELLSLLPAPQAFEQGMQRFTAPHRRKEWLAVRVLLYQLLHAYKEIGYEPSGKPYLTDHSQFLSISHTKGYVAVLLSPVAEVGIDIEQYGQRIYKVAHKFMREDECVAAYLGDTAWGLLLHWSAKEAMFKCLPADEVDFRAHLQIAPFEIQSQGTFDAREYRTERQGSFLIHYLIHPDFVLTWLHA
ncbi:MAG: 4'-phosphopantetheinyl transferase superfamily protein [Bacteroides sp.]